MSNEMKWIPVSERLPELWVGVLITDGKIVTCGERSDYKADEVGWTSHGFWGCEWDWKFEVEDITHWMPLPKPPEEK